MRKSMTTVDTVVVILIFGITAVLAIAFVKYYIGKGNVPIPIGNPSETVRFIRYMSCAIAECVGGCDSSMTYSISLEYGEGDQPTLGCNQLLHELGYCTGANPEAKFCDRAHALNFIFRKETEYIGNYFVTWDNPGPCSPGLQSGFQTDASCLSGWETSGIIDCACFQCAWPGTRPAGKLGKYEGSEDCGRMENPWPYTDYLAANAGTIWIPSSLVSDIYEPGKCVKAKIPDFGDKGLGMCKFKKDQTIYIWAEITWHAYQDCWPFGICSLIPSSHPCPQIVTCDNP